MQPGHYQFFLIPPKNPYSNQATPKDTCQIFVPQKNPGIDNFKPKKIFRSSPSLKIPSTPPGELWSAVLTYRQPTEAHQNVG